MVAILLVSTMVDHVSLDAIWVWSYMRIPHYVSMILAFFEKIEKYCEANQLASGLLRRHHLNLRYTATKYR